MDFANWAPKVTVLKERVASIDVTVTGNRVQYFTTLAANLLSLLQILQPCLSSLGQG